MAPTVPREKQWVETADKVTGLIYFYNRGTRESSWTRPTGDDIVIIVRRDKDKAGGKPSKAAMVNSQLVRMMRMMRRLAKPSCQRDCHSKTKPTKPSQASRQEKK